MLSDEFESIGGQLLNGDDPAPYEQLNGGSSTPLLLLCDHAGNNVPERLAALGLPAELFAENHIAVDLGAADVTRGLASELNARTLLANYSRLVIDVNRPAGHPASIPAVSDGIAIPGNLSLPAGDVERRHREVLWPYHHAVDNEIATLWGFGRAPLVVVIHSFTPRFSGFDRPWDIGILWDQDDRVPALLHDWFARFHPGLRVGDNKPYSGRDMAFTLERHASAAGLPHVALEIRQDLLLNAQDRQQWVMILVAALRAVLATTGIHRVQHF